MKIEFDFEEDTKLSSIEINEIRQKLIHSEKLIEKTLPGIRECLEKLEKNSEYFEINLPVFEYGLTLTFSKLKDKFLITVSDHIGKISYGSLILNEIPCMKIKDIKKLRIWEQWN